MLRRVLIAAFATAAFLPAQQLDQILMPPALALRDGPASAFTAYFDPKTPGLAQISKDVARTLASTMVDSQITVVSNTGSDSVRNLQLDWNLRLTAHDTSTGVTTRSERVTATVEHRGDKWIFTSFTPAGFFHPGPGTQAWDLVSAASSAMRNGNAEGFLADFDRSMPDYQRLVRAVNALVQSATVESSLELKSVEGTDTERTMEIDWTLSLAQGAFANNPRSEANLTAQWHDIVHVKAALQGKKWRITAIDPIAFFDHPPLAR